MLNWFMYFINDLKYKYKYSKYKRIDDKLYVKAQIIIELLRLRLSYKNLNVSGIKDSEIQSIYKNLNEFISLYDLITGHILQGGTVTKSLIKLNFEIIKVTDVFISSDGRYIPLETLSVFLDKSQTLIDYIQSQLTLSEPSITTTYNARILANVTASVLDICDGLLNLIE